MKIAHHPRQTTELIGLKSEEAGLLEQWYEKRLPHALLFSGPQGVGKATLAYRFARFILSGEGDAENGGASLFGDALPPVQKATMAVDTETPVCQRIAHGSHPDLLVLEPEYDEKKDSYKAVIPIEAARKVGHFLSQTSSEGGWKIIIIDPVDALNPNAANALLKWLEEPPNRCLFMLISHRSGSLLPTILSRCQKLSFGLQAPQEFAAMLSQHGIHASDTDLALLQKLSSGSAGLAATLHHEQAERHYHDILEILAKGNDPALLTFAEKISSGKEAPAWATLERLFSLILNQIIKLASGMAPQTQDSREIDVLKGLSSRKSLDYWLELWENGTRLLTDAERLNLNKKHALLVVLFALCGKEHVADAIG